VTDAERTARLAQIRESHQRYLRARRETEQAILRATRSMVLEDIEEMPEA
jgi:hypothetical protein